MSRPSNNQLAFNIVWKHFVTKQGKQSVTEDKYTGDMYWALRGPYRRRDAIGLLIADEDYEEDMERLDVEQLVEAYPNLQLVTKDLEFLKELEWAHDFTSRSDKEFSQRVESRLRGVAEKFKLQIPQ